MCAMHTSHTSPLPPNSPTTIKYQNQSNYISNLPCTWKYVVITRGGYVEIWHSYWPSSVLLVSAIRNRQLFGYWNSTLNRESPLYVCMPTVSNCKLSLFGSRFTHDTYDVFFYYFQFRRSSGQHSVDVDNIHRWFLAHNAGHFCQIWKTKKTKKTEIKEEREKQTRKDIISDCNKLEIK